MIDLLTWAVPAASSVGVAAVAFVVGARRGRNEARDRDATERQRLVAARDAAEGRARVALAECARLQGLSLAGATVNRPSVFTDRMSAADAESLVTLLRGIAFVDDAVITDARGLPLSRETDARSSLHAAVAAPVASAARRLALSAIPVAQIAFETFAAEHVCVTPLVGSAQGALLVVATTSLSANPLAVDAVALACSRPGEPGLAPAPVRSVFGATEVHGAPPPALSEAAEELKREVRGSVRGVALVYDAASVFSRVDDGPRADVRAALLAAIDPLQRRVADLLRTSGMARVHISLRDGSSVVWAALAPRSRLAVLFFGEIDRRAVDRITGRLRRVVGEHALAGSTEEGRVA